MAAQVGRDLGFTWNGASVAGIQEKGISLNGEPIDITSGENNGKRALLAVAAQDEVSISISGITKSRVLLADWFAGTRTRTVVMTYDDGSTITGTFFLQSYTDTGPYNAAVTFEAQLLSTGTIVYTAGA
jgi:predicted secreted protein